MAKSVTKAAKKPKAPKAPQAAILKPTMSKEEVAKIKEIIAANPIKSTQKGRGTRVERAQSLFGVSPATLGDALAGRPLTITNALAIRTRLGISPDLAPSS